MLYNMLIANQGIILGWSIVLLIVLALQFLIWRIPKPSQLDREIASNASSWVWTIFFLITVLGVVGVSIGQSVNILPREREDRRPSESDRRNFEYRIQNGVKHVE